MELSFYVKKKSWITMKLCVYSCVNYANVFVLQRYMQPFFFVCGFCEMRNLYYICHERPCVLDLERKSTDICSSYFGFFFFQCAVGIG